MTSPEASPIWPVPKGTALPQGACTLKSKAWDPEKETTKVKEILRTSAKGSPKMTALQQAEKEII